MMIRASGCGDRERPGEGYGYIRWWEAPGKWRCPKCGHDLENDHVFCMNCGYKKEDQGKQDR